MLDFIRDLTKSAEEKRQEMLTAYVDGALSPRHQSAFEQQLSQDPSLQAEVEQMQQHKLMMRQLPRRRVPRNFTLDPALYSPPQRQPLLQLYPAMRVATVLTAVFLIIAVSAELLTFSGSADLATESTAPIAMQSESVTTNGAAADDMADAVSDDMAEAEMPVVEDAASEMEAAEMVVEEAEEMAVEAESAEMASPEESDGEVAGAAAEPPLDEDASMLEIAATPPKPEVEIQTEEQFAEAETDADSETTVVSPPPTASPSSPRMTTTAVTGRAVEATVPAATEIAAAPTSVVETDDGVPAVAPPTPPPVRQPVSTLRVVQIGLAILLIVMITAVVYTRRKLNS